MMYLGEPRLYIGMEFDIKKGLRVELSIFDVFIYSCIYFTDTFVIEV